MNRVAALGGIARGMGWRPEFGDRCDLCPGSLLGGHEHAVDSENLTMVCVCRECASGLHGRSGSTRYRAPSTRVLADPEFQISEAAWAALQVPVLLAYFWRRPLGGDWVAMYPSRSGTIRRELSPADGAFLTASRLAQALIPGIEVLLVAGPSGRGPLDSLVVPLDRVHGPISIMREVWAGFLDQREAWPRIAAVFSDLRAFAAFLSPGPETVQATMAAT